MTNEEFKKIPFKYDGEGNRSRLGNPGRFSQEVNAGKSKGSSRRDIR